MGIPVLSKQGPGPLPSRSLPTELPKAKMPYVSLELEVRPLTAAGLIFHLGQAQATPYVQLEVLTEQVLLRANDGAGEFSTWVTYPKLCDGRWHRVAVIKGRNTLRLEVDTQSNHTTGRLPETLADSPVLLHLGSLPKSSTAQPEPPAYRGCLRKLLINGAPVNMTASVQVQGAVGMRGCPSGTLALPKQGKALSLRQANPSVFPLLWH